MDVNSIVFGWIYILTSIIARLLASRSFPDSCRECTSWTLLCWFHAFYHEGYHHIHGNSNDFHLVRVRCPACSGTVVWLGWMTPNIINLSQLKFISPFIFMVYHWQCHIGKKIIYQTQEEQASSATPGNLAISQLHFTLAGLLLPPRQYNCI